MSDSAAADVVRKRSRSPSPSGGQSPSLSKKPDSKPAPTELELADDSAIPSAAEDNTPATVDEVKPEAAVAEMQTDETKPDAAAAPAEEGAPMALDAAPATAPAPAPGADGPASIQMRALIVTQDASIIIGKQGKNVNEIREKSGSKVTITESVPGNPERVMVVGGQLDAVSKAFGLIVRRINDEPFDVPSVPGSRMVTIRFIIPNARMGSVIGKGGSKIKEIQEASGARLQASEAMLPGSTERVLSVSGVADAIHIAVYYIGTILQEGPQQAGGVVNQSYRPGQGGAYGGQEAYGAPRGAYAGGGAPQQPRGPPAPGPGAQTQQIYIPNELVGSIIGKGGQKINEVRQASQCQIKISEPGEGQAPGASPAERLVTITGQPVGIQTAVRLLYERLEQEKQKQLGGGM